MVTLEYATVRAYLDPITGAGLIVTPDHADDIPPPVGGGLSLQQADWNNAVRHLDRIGWEPLPDDDGAPYFVGDTRDGCTAHAMMCRHPARRNCPTGEWLEACRALEQAAGV